MAKHTVMVSATEVVSNSLGDEKLCFEIPIYRCKEDKYGDEMAKQRERCLGPLSRLREKAPQSFAAAERRSDENEWYPWLYNEAIGWIQISVHSTEIKGELYFVRAKKIGRDMKECFRWAGELFEIDVFPNDSSTKIYDAICAELDKFRSQRPYRKRHLDSEALGNTGPFVDWRGLVNFFQGNGAKQVPELTFWKQILESANVSRIS